MIIRCGADGTDQPTETELGDGCVSGHGSGYGDNNGDGDRAGDSDDVFNRRRFDPSDCLKT